MEIVMMNMYFTMFDKQIRNCKKCKILTKILE